MLRWRKTSIETNFLWHYCYSTGTVFNGNVWQELKPKINNFGSATLSQALWFHSLCSFYYDFHLFFKVFFSTLLHSETCRPEENIKSQLSQFFNSSNLILMFTTDFRPFLISLSGRFPDKKVRIIRPAEYTFYSGCNYLHFNLLYTYILLDPDLCEPVSNLQLPVLLHQVEAVPGQRVEVAVRHPVQALHGHKYASH